MTDCPPQNYEGNTRLISICHPHNKYNASPNVGTSYTLALWSVKSKAPADASQIKFSFETQSGAVVTGPSANYDTVRGVLSVQVPVDNVPDAGTGLLPENPTLVVKVTGLGA